MTAPVKHLDPLVRLLSLIATCRAVTVDDLAARMNRSRPTIVRLVRRARERYGVVIVYENNHYRICDSGYFDANRLRKQ